MEYKKEEFTKLIEKLRNESGVDLSMTEDLSLAVMNLISLEEHFFFTAEKTGKASYFDVMNDVREVRKKALERLVGEHEGETWCATKHLLATAMRLIEVGTKLHKNGKKDEAKKVFDDAYRIYSIFWALRLKLISVKDVAKSSGEGDKDKVWSLEDITSKLADCCSE